MEMNELLVRAGLPKDLLREIGSVQDHQELATIWPIIIGPPARRVILMLGPATPKKDLLCAVLLKGLMDFRKKKGLWLTPAKIPSSQQWGETGSLFPTSGVTAILGVDLLNQQQARLVAAHLREQIPEDRKFILEVSSLAALEEILGVHTMNYIAFHACQLNLVHASASIPGV